MALRPARDGLPAIFTLSALAVAVFFLSRAASIIFLFPLGMALWFYRDPERTPPSDPSVWVSPADGRVVEVIPDAADPYAGTTTKIGIFMSGFDVHVNRFPADGDVEEIVYSPGKKWFAIAPKASELNERLYVRAVTRQGRTTVTQIAGIMARRIACHAKSGEHIARGARYGMIKLGSKVDVYIPRGVKPVVSVGDKVRAGESIIGVVED
jgi:phosphatidylserine decarboxylase